MVSILGSHSPDELPPRPLSRLSYQIMGLNLIALLVLIAGVFYLDQYKKDLTIAETELLTTEAQLYASLFTDNALKQGKIDLAAAEHLFQTFNIQKLQRLRMFDEKGALILDTRIENPGAIPDERSGYPSVTGRAVQKIWDFFSEITSISFDLPLYPRTDDNDIHSFPDAPEAINGKPSISAWSDRTGGLILSAAVPMLKSSKLVGVILVTRPSARIAHNFASMRLSVFQFFCGSLLITLCFSLYLSASIGHPLRKLASATEAFRETRGSIDLIPDLSFRKDEIGELSLALRQMTMALQDRIETIERFAADVSHELKNPLTSMRSAVETLEKIKREEDREKLMRIIMHDLLRMDRLISDISRATRLDVDVLRDAMGDVDLGKIILPLIDVYRKPLDREDDAAASVRIIAEGLDQPVLVSGQSVPLSQVFQNLIANALTFSPPGCPVRVSVRQGPEYVNVFVEDEGPGIPDNRLEKIFERFYTERPNSEAFGSHSGLGLAIARGIVNACGGSIVAQNRKGENGETRGARFIVRLKPA